MDWIQRAQERRQQQQEQPMKPQVQQTIYTPVDWRAKALRARDDALRERPKPLGRDSFSTSPNLKYLDEEELSEREEEEEANGERDQSTTRARRRGQVSRVLFEKCEQQDKNDDDDRKKGKSYQMNKQEEEAEEKTYLGRCSPNSLGGSKFTSPLANNNNNNNNNKRPSRFKHQPEAAAVKYQDHDHLFVVNNQDLDGNNLVANKTRAPGRELNQPEETASLEEVYLCNCCGVTRPLDPAMKYLPLFRGTFILFNFLVFAFGLANLSMGVWFRIDPKVYEIHKYIETQNYTYAGWIMLAGGFGACMMALAGFAGARKQSICLLISYALTMTLLTIAFIGALVLLTVYGLGAQLERFMNKEIYEQIRRRTMSTELDLMLAQNSESAGQFLDFVQVKLRCCGAQDFRDYQKLGMIIPTTCYTIAGNYINAPGCGQALRELFDMRAGLAAGTTAASVIAQLATTLLSSLMVCSIYNWRATPRPATPQI